MRDRHRLRDALHQAFVGGRSGGVTTEIFGKASIVWVEMP